MPSEKAFIAHANDDVRCEKREPPHEDIDQAKMELIDSIWGASWEDIYEILFPGAPIPSACRFSLNVLVQSNRSNTFYLDYEADIERAKTGAPGLSECSAFDEFEAYARRELPPMLEARLWARMNAYGGPIAEAFRELLAEILPSCQSLVAENFRSIRGLSTVPPDIPQIPFPSVIQPVLFGAETLSREWELPTVMTTQQPFDFVQPSSHVDPEQILPDERTKHGTDCQRKDECQLASSAYGPPMPSCFCACHNEYNETPRGKDCGYCGTNHLDSQFSFDDMFDLPDI